MDKLTDAGAKSVAGLNEDWQLIKDLLPAGWEQQARQLRAFMQKHGIANAETLLRILFIHLSDGCSLRQTAVRAAEGGLATVSDVALLKRLRHCGDWFGWMTKEVAGSMVDSGCVQRLGRQVRLVDGSIVNEPGAKSSTWRLHYALNLATLRCDEVHVTPVKQGETLARFAVQPGEILMADRGYAHRRGLRYVIDQGGDLVVRMNLDNVPLEDPSGVRFNVLATARQLGYGEAGSWPVAIRDEHGVLPLRLCAIKKSQAQTQKAQDKLRQQAKKRQRVLKSTTLEAAGYVMVLSTLKEVTADMIMALYRLRWQVELAFKRLKSLLQVGHLKKTDPVGAMAWLQGKLLIAALLEKMRAIGEHFSPWGYLAAADPATAAPLLLAGNGTDAFPVQPCGQSSAVPDQRAARLGQDCQSVTGATTTAPLSARSI